MIWLWLGVKGTLGVLGVLGLIITLVMLFSGRWSLEEALLLGVIYGVFIWVGRGKLRNWLYGRKGVK